MTTDNKAPRDIEWTAADIADHVQRSKLDGGELFIEKSAYDKLQKELDAVRLKIAEYEAALEKIKNGGVPYGVSADVTDRMLAMCEIARETLKKWKAK